MHSDQMTAELVAGFAKQAMATILQIKNEYHNLEEKLEEMSFISDELSSRNDELEDENKKLTDEHKKLEDRLATQTRWTDMERNRADIFREKLKEMGVDTEKVYEESL